MHCDFEWDPRKAAQNVAKHAVSFELASTVFRDSNALSIYDATHSSEEDRWLTLGFGLNGMLLVVHHTFVQLDEHTALIRVISARKATAREQRQYMEQAP